MPSANAPHIGPSHPAMVMTPDPTTFPGMINVTMHFTYPPGLWGPDHVSFWLSPLYNLPDTDTAAEMIQTLLQSGLDPVFLVDSAGELWPVFPATVDHVLLATPSVE